MLSYQVFKNVYLAQMASDAGKRIYILPSLDSKGKKLGYAQKDEYIIRAISLIIKKQDTGFSFYVTDGGNVTPYLVYFETRIGSERYQISFHSFNHALKKYMNSKKHRTVWDEKSSRDNCLTLKEVMKYMG